MGLYSDTRSAVDVSATSAAVCWDPIEPENGRLPVWSPRSAESTTEAATTAMSERRVRLLESASGTSVLYGSRRHSCSSALEDDVRQLVDLILDAFPEDGQFNGSSNRIRRGPHLA